MAPSGHTSVQSGQNTHAPRSIVSGLAEIAPVGQASTHFAQPSGQREESIFGLPRNVAGSDAAAMSGMTGWPSASRTLSAFENRKFIGFYVRGARVRIAEVALSAAAFAAVIFPTTISG